MPLAHVGDHVAELRMPNNKVNGGVTGNRNYCAIVRIGNDVQILVPVSTDNAAIGSPIACSSELTESLLLLGVGIAIHV